MSNMLNATINAWTPRHYANMTDTERHAAREGFEAGRQYEASLRGGQPGEVVEGPCCFGDRCPEAGTDHTHVYTLSNS